MNNEDRVICAREREKRRRGAAAAGGGGGEERGSFEAGSSRFVDAMRMGGRAFRQGYITHAAQLEGGVAAIYGSALMEETP